MFQQLLASQQVCLIDLLIEPGWMQQWKSCSDRKEASLWTPAAIGCTIAATCAVPAPGHGGMPAQEMVAMTPKKRSRSATRPPLLLMLILMLASTASAEWKEKVLYSFQSGTDGAYPAGGVVFDKQGNLYGATQQGGGTNCSPMAACGTVYQLAPPVKQGDPWTETVLHVFQGKQQNDGEFPSGGVIADALGNIYGTSSYGGTGDCILLGIKGGCGTVFELSPPQSKGGKWTYTILYSFKGGKDGYLPFGDLVFDGAGNLYGATFFGGGKGTTCDPYYQYCGTVFKLSLPKSKGGKWTEKVLHSFAGGTDGANPNGGLALDSKGNVYGTTNIGGYEGGQCGTVGCGTAFELKPPTQKGGAWTEKQLHTFAGGNDGAVPVAGMILDSNGNLYGITVGTLFRLAPPPPEIPPLEGNDLVYIQWLRDWM
jgi:hypothetical protein